MIDIAKRSQVTRRLGPKRSVQDRQSLGLDRQSKEPSAELISFGTQPTFHLTWLSPATEYVAEAGFSSVDLLTLSRIDIAMIFLPESDAEACSQENLASLVPNVSQLVVCGTETAGQAWLPQQTSAESLSETRQFPGLPQACGITRAFSLASGLYSAGALARRFSGDCSALIVLPTSVSLESVLPELSSVQSIL